MKNMTKGRYAPVIGSIVLAALLVLGVVGCDLDTTTTGGLAGTVSISPSGTVNVNTQLTASYSGSETGNRQWQWLKDGSTINGATSSTYTPTTAGSYTVRVTIGTQNKTSAAVTVTDTPQASSFYVITKGTDYSVKQGNSFAAANTTLTLGASPTIADVIDRIKSDANGKAIAIQFGDGTTALDIGDSTAAFSGSGWGYIEIDGKVTGAKTTAPKATVLFADGISATSKADVTATGTDGIAIRKEGSGAITVSEGTVAGGTSTGYGVEITAGTGNTASGSLTVSGGTITGSNALDVSNSASVTVSGGTITGSSAGVLTYTTSNTVTISGGTISATANNGNAIRDMGPSTFILSGTAVITSANNQTTGDNQGTIRLWYSTSDPVVSDRTVLTIASTVQVTNTGGGVDIYNPRGHKVEDSRPAITFYILTKESANFVAKKNGTAITNGTDTDIQKVLTAINADADGKDITIQFGNGTTALDLGNQAKDQVIFTDEDMTKKWGTITLTGKVTSAIAYANDDDWDACGTICIETDPDATPPALITVISKADVTNTATRFGCGFELADGCSLEIQSGTISAVYRAISIQGDDVAVKVTGETVTITGVNYTDNEDNDQFGWAAVGWDTDFEGTLEVTGGTISATGTTGPAGSNGSYGGDAILVGKGDITISGGTITSKWGSAILFDGPNASGKVTVTGGTMTSEGLNPTVWIMDTATAATDRFVMSGGTIEFKGGGDEFADSAALYIDTNNGSVKINSGSTIKYTGNDDQAWCIYKDDAVNKSKVTIATDVTLTNTKESSRVINWTE